jgi:predicted nucleic acid-binding Zn ribbon protein
MLRLSSVRMERAGQALAKLKFSDAISRDQLAFAAWPAAVGKRIAVHAHPKALVRGSLVVEAEDGIWQKQLFHLRFDILAKLTEVLGSGVVTDIEFRVAKGVPRRPPQSAQSHSESASHDDADSIQDPVMRILYKQARTRATKKATA